MVIMLAESDGYAPWPGNDYWTETAIYLTRTRGKRARVWSLYSSNMAFTSSFDVCQVG